VYDCGSEPKAHVLRELKQLLAASENRDLDVLFISHFDRDHICGVPHLLKSGAFTTHTIVLPYLDIAERIIALARAFSDADQYRGRIDSFFVNMVFDPIGTLTQFGPQQIILVRSDVDWEDEGLAGMQPRPELDPQPKRSPSTHRPAQVKLVAAYPSDPSRPLEMVEITENQEVKVVVVRNAAMVVSHACENLRWKLLPWVRPAGLPQIMAFRHEIEKLFGWPTHSFYNHIYAVDVRKKMVTALRQKVSKIYERTFLDKNLTSMSVYSGPLEPEKVDAVAVFPCLDQNETTKIGWLGTGDAHLRESSEQVAFQRGFEDNLHYVSTFLFPHHGSIKNSDPDELITSADYWVASADPIHDWEHPHWKLKQAVYDLNKQFRHVRSVEETGFAELFYIGPRS
jgi:hypothetical protein